MRLNGSSQDLQGLRLCALAAAVGLALAQHHAMLYLLFGQGTTY